MDKLSYLNAAIDALEKLEALQKQREAIDAEAMKLEQFIVATANMLPDDGKDEVLKSLELRQELFRLGEAGLTNAIRSILKSGEWVTVTNVRDLLEKTGFDFSEYSTNPLASISTVLRRMPSEDVERKLMDGVTVYRWKHPVESATFAAIRRVLAGQDKGTLSDMAGLAVPSKLTPPPPRGLTPPPQALDEMENALKAPFRKKK